MREFIIGYLSLCTALTVLGTVLVTLAERRDAAARETARRARAEACRHGDHRTTIDATRATIYEQCIDCGFREVYGHAYITGTNKRPRRRAS
jgi:hypothetical protein